MQTMPSSMLRRHSRSSSPSVLSQVLDLCCIGGAAAGFALSLSLCAREPAKAPAAANGNAKLSTLAPIMGTGRARGGPLDQVR